MAGVIDAQGFLGRNGEFVIKELAILYKGATQVERFYLKWPYPLSELPKHRRKTITYVRQRIHGLDWFDGGEDYQRGISRIKSGLKSDCKYYCKGEDKAKALSSLLDVQVYNVEHFFEECEYQSYFVYSDNPGERCALHAKKDSYYKCAVKEVFVVSALLNEFFSPSKSMLSAHYLDMKDIDARLESFSQLRSPLAVSPVSHHLARIGYYCVQGYIRCHFCGSVSTEWEKEGVVQPLNIRHFHEDCYGVDVVDSPPHETTVVPT